MPLGTKAIINREINISKYDHKIFCCNEVANYVENIHILDDILCTITNINGIQFMAVRIDAIGL